jgi:hypothetical protein
MGLNVTKVVGVTDVEDLEQKDILILIYKELKKIECHLRLMTEEDFCNCTLDEEGDEQ